MQPQTCWKEQSHILDYQLSGRSHNFKSAPALLMLDEPSLGLAPLIVRHIFEIVKTVNHSGVTILLVEQNIRQTLAISEYGYILENGKLVLEDVGKNLLQNESVKKAYLGYSGGAKWKK
jgi:branched-chain amino acid transport system ATP-binding protein